ncbi:MAG: serine O-acetyltransferase [Acidimicrobiaceae bacterium]|nr:serine O-acetyltransferase [Acidimicrobiaceae bacterium]
MTLSSTLRRDVQVILERDPAARGVLDVVLTYPGLHALWGYRFSHVLWRSRMFLLARLVSSGVRVMTGVDIHPGAKIGQGLFIDHAIGVVIGETAQIGDDVTMYHAVTLGGLTLNKGKRHPTVGDRVMIGAGAKILGPVVIGDDSRIGANAVVVHDVPSGSVIVGVPGRILAPQGHVAGPAEVVNLLERVEEIERHLSIDDDFVI